ncbi:MAG: hypothetical protein IID18_06620 [Nitrospinae bacterium]|nr:hypothetical protein [Nitrospinota bacterium]
MGRSKKLNSPPSQWAEERSLILLQQEGYEYRQANDNTNECFPVLEHGQPFFPPITFILSNTCSLVTIPASSSSSVKASRWYILVKAICSTVTVSRSGFIPLRGMKANEEISHEQGAEITRIGQYVSNGYRWARAGVDVNFDDSTLDAVTTIPNLALIKESTTLLDL